jgi:hypothetical protein
MAERYAESNDNLAKRIWMQGDVIHGKFYVVNQHFEVLGHVVNGAKRM